MSKLIRLKHTANGTTYEGTELEVVRQWLMDDGGAYRLERIIETVLDDEGEDTGEVRYTGDWQVYQKTSANDRFRATYTVEGETEEEAEVAFLTSKINDMWADEHWMANTPTSAMEIEAEALLAEIDGYEPRTFAVADALAAARAAICAAKAEDESA